MRFSARVADAKDKFDNTGNRQWWETNPMLYDWKGACGEPVLTEEYFKKIDHLFGEGHSLLNNPAWPDGKVLERFIPYSLVSGKDVLEIGCGAGLLSSHLAGSGARLVAMDITERAVRITRKRFGLKGLGCAIAQMEGERLAFRDASFDYVVSWGVIHHSGDMEAILNEIHRVLRPGGKAYIMVYNRNSIRYQVYCRFWLGVVRRELFKKRLDEIAGGITDGYIARHLTRDEFATLAARFSALNFSFSDEALSTSSYLLGRLHKLLKPVPGLLPMIERKLARRWGWYMEVVATK